MSKQRLWPIVLFLIVACVCGCSGTATGPTELSSVTPAGPTRPSGPVFVTGKEVLTGKVLDRVSSAPLAGATVVFSWPHPSPRVTTDSLGNYTLVDLPAPGGNAYVWAMADGYEEDTRPYRAASQDFRLYPIELIRAGGSTVVTVRPDDSLCNTDSFPVSWGVDQVCRVVRIEPTEGVLTVEALPINGGSRPALEVMALSGNQWLDGRVGNPASVKATGASRILAFVVVAPGSPTQSFSLTASAPR